MTSPYATFSARPLRGIFAPVVWRRSYANILYLLVGFPLGMAYFIVYVTGFALGIGLLILGVGLLILAVLVLLARPLAALERALAVHLLGVPVVPPRTEPFSSDDPWRWIRGVYSSGATWKGLLFLILKFPLGLFSWMAVVVGLSVVGAFVVAPIAVALGAHASIGFWSPATPGEALLLVPVGLVGYVVAIHLFNALAWAWGRLARLLLGGKPAPRPEIVGAAQLAA